MEATVVENFFGVYLLSCDNPKFKGRSYIGFTVDPGRRLKRHNAGIEFGGAKKTHNKGPWKMILFIYGFPSARLGLRFEWAWQHLDISRHTKNFPKKKTNESKINYLISSVAEMLKASPWNRLPLCFQWMDLQIANDWILKLHLPNHMNVRYGPVEVKKIIRSQQKTDNIYSQNINCFICYKPVDLKYKVECVYKMCNCITHIDYLAQIFTKKDRKILPISGICPKAVIIFVYGEISLKRN